MWERAQARHGVQFNIRFGRSDALGAVEYIYDGVSYQGVFEQGLTVAGDGHSLAAIWQGKGPPDWRQAVLIEHHGPDDSPGDPDAQNNAEADPPSYEAVRTATALYVVYSDGEQEYYNTAKDPNELDNIAGRGVPFALKHALYAMEHCHGSTSCWAASHLTRA